MKLDKRLNFAFPVLDGEDQIVLWVHSMPIARTVFETFYDVLGLVFTDCFAGDDPRHIVMTAPQIAYPALKSIAQARGTWEIRDKDGAVTGGVKAGLINEIIRLTSVASVTADSGWKTIPLHTAIAQKIVDEEMEAEILSALVFFTCISRAAPRNLASTFLEVAATTRGWRFTPSACMEFMNSLPTSIPATDTQTIPPSVIS